MIQRDASVGIKGTTEQVSIGINGSGRRVTKRIYRFKGWNDSAAASTMNNLDENKK